MRQHVYRMQQKVCRTRDVVIAGGALVVTAVVVGGGMPPVVVAVIPEMRAVVVAPIKFILR